MIDYFIFAPKIWYLILGSKFGTLYGSDIFLIYVFKYTDSKGVKETHMQYEHFIRVIESYQTQHVQAIAFPGSCAPEQVPSEFAVLFADIVIALEQKHHLLCQPDEVIAIFGIQAGPALLKSRLPLRLNRIICDGNPTYHLCLVLQYLITKPSQLRQLSSWQGSRNLVLDFTTGHIMDPAHYVALVQQQALQQGLMLGQMNQQRLTRVWERLNLMNFKQALQRHYQ